MVEEIAPIGIILFDQLQLPGTPPFLDGLLARDRHVDIGKGLGVYELKHPIAMRKLAPLPFRCCQTRFARSPVTPTYSVPFWQLAKM